MRSKTKVITIKLTEPEVRELADLVARGKFTSVSAAIRAGLDAVFEKYLYDPKRLDAIRYARVIHPGRQGKVRRLLLDDSPTGPLVLPDSQANKPTKSLMETMIE